MTQKNHETDLSNAPIMTQKQVDAFLDYLDVQISEKKQQGQFEDDPEVRQLEAIKRKFVGILYELLPTDKRGKNMFEIGRVYDFIDLREGESTGPIGWRGKVTAIDGTLIAVSNDREIKIINTASPLFFSAEPVD